MEADLAEARRFLRYLFPGMIFIILLSLYLFLSAGMGFVNVVREAMKEAKDGGGILQAGVFILFVPGMGYFFATVYHWITKKKYRLPNHSGLLRDAVAKNWMTVIDRGENTDDAKAKNIYCPSQAWSIMGAYYHARIHKKMFRHAHNRIESLNDTLHGLGASWVAAMFAFAVWIIIMTWAHEADHYYRISAVGFIAFIVIFILIRNWHLTGVEATNFLDGITAKFLEEESEKGTKPIPVYFPETRRHLKK